MFFYKKNRENDLINRAVRDKVSIVMHVLLKEINNGSV